MTAGLTAGAVAAILAVLVSLPLRSPSDTLFNSATVALAGLLAGVVAGIIWQMSRRSGRSRARFAVIWTIVFFIPTAAAVVAGEYQLDNFAVFAIPLAAVIFLVTGLLTVAIAHYYPRLKWWAAAISVGLAVIAGGGLAGQGDQESGKLRLPPPASRSAPSIPAPSTPAPSVQAPSLPAAIVLVSPAEAASLWSAHNPNF